MAPWLLLLLGLASAGCYFVTSTDDISGAELPGGASGQQTSGSGGGGGDGSTCSDDTRNGGETDVDCGGGTCPPCANDRACNDANDCDSGYCAGLCAPWAIAVSAGSFHSCAVTAAGGVSCWGSNKYGQLGDGLIADSSVAVAVTKLPADVIAVSAGDGHTCAMTETGEVWCWGFNNAGQLGNGSTDGTSTHPVQVSGFASGVVESTSLAAARFSAAGGKSCALTAADGAQCWGWGASGQLGNGLLMNSRVPVDVTGLTSGVAAIASGGRHACALLAEGGVSCWGLGRYGELGTGAAADAAEPVSVTGLPPGIAAVAAGQLHTCALTGSGGVLCWGFNASGQLGSEETTTTPDGPIAFGPVPVATASTSISAISAGGGPLGGGHTCALTESRTVRCWGAGNSGQLGNGALASSTAAVDVSGLSSGALAVSAGGEHTCALTTSFGVRCWGSNEFGQLGDGTKESRPEPVTVLAP